MRTGNYSAVSSSQHASGGCSDWCDVTNWLVGTVDKAILGVLIANECLRQFFQRRLWTSRRMMTTNVIMSGVDKARAMITCTWWPAVTSSFSFNTARSIIYSIHHNDDITASCVMSRDDCFIFTLVNIGANTGGWGVRTPIIFGRTPTFYVAFWWTDCNMSPTAPNWLDLSNFFL